MSAVTAFLPFAKELTLARRSETKGANQGCSLLEGVAGSPLAEFGADGGGEGAENGEGGSTVIGEVWDFFALAG